MAKRKQESKRPQPSHKASKKSQHDRRERLDRPHPERLRTAGATVPLTGVLAAMVAGMARILDVRIAFRFGIIVAGMLLAGGRRTASAWFVAAGVRDDWDRFYECLISVGRSAQKLAAVVLERALQVAVTKVAGPDGASTVERVLLGIDARPRRGTDVTSKGRGSIIIPRPVPPMASGCTVTTGCRWRCSRGMRCGA